MGVMEEMGAKAKFKRGKMFGKCAANLANSAARVGRLLAKCAANVRRIFFS